MDDLVEIDGRDAQAAARLEDPEARRKKPLALLFGKPVQEAAAVQKLDAAVRGRRERAHRGFAGDADEARAQTPGQARQVERRHLLGVSRPAIALGGAHDNHLIHHL